MTDVKPPVLLVMIEPAPYITRLARELGDAWGGPVTTVFLTSGATQCWSESAGLEHEVLPSGVIAAVCRLWVILGVTRPAVVHVAGWGLPLIIAAILMARLRGARVVASSDTWISESGGLRSALKRVVLRRITRFAPGGTRQAAYVHRHGIAAERILPANMTVDVAGIRAFHASRGAAARAQVRTAMKLADGDVLFVCVSRLSPEKGVDILIDAFARLEAAAHAHLLIVGAGAERARLEARASGLERISFAGRLTGAALLAAYAAADVFVAASRRESWGLVVNEAMAARLPVILPDCFGCLDDLVRPGETGLVVPAENAGALAHAMLDLAADPERRQRMGLAAEQLIAGWTIEAQAALVMRSWRSALGAPK